jgi:hypothetical protein
MKKSGILVLGGLLLIHLKLISQSEYMAGTSQASIEPYQSLISLHLGGYGAPRDGRFTLQWISRGNTPDAVAMAGLNDKIYIVSGGKLLYLVPSEAAQVWKNAGKAENIISIAGFNGKLFALRVNGELLESSAGEKARWKKIGSVVHDVTQIAASDNRFFATDGNGTLWTTDLSRKGSEWRKSESVVNIVSLSANNGKLYALTRDGVIYRHDLSGSDHRWVKIAYRNNQTIKEDIKLISFLNDRIYAIGSDNSFYLGEHRSDGNLTARALAIKGGEQTVVIVNVDICGLTADFTGMIKKEILQKHNLPFSAVFINCSHTHFAPVAQNWLTWQEANQRPDSIFLYSIIKNGILNAVDKALEKMAPAELYFGRGTTDIGYNRSLKDHPELYDSNVDVLKIANSDKKSESYLFMAACHPVFSTAGTLHYTISANYPGVARKLVEERTGTSNSLFLQGTAGDINPKDNGEYITGEKLANNVVEILNNPMKKIEGPISFFLDTVKIPIKPWTREEIVAYRTENADKTGDVYAEKNVKWCDLMMDYYNKGTMPESMPVYVQTLNIGNWKLIGFSRETTTSYGFGVKKMWPDKMISVAGYTNDVSSYLPTHMHLEANTYEGLDSFFWYGMPNVFPMNVDEVILGQVRTLAH